MRAGNAISAVLTVLLTVQRAYAAAGNASLWNTLKQIPIIQNNFYVQDVVKFLVYLNLFLIVVAIGMIMVGGVLSGKRQEAAEMLVAGKRALVWLLITLVLLLIADNIVSFLISASGSTGNYDLPSW